MTSSSGANVTTVISKIKEIQKSGALLSSLQSGVPSLSLQAIAAPTGKSHAILKKSGLAFFEDVHTIILLAFLC